MLITPTFADTALSTSSQSVSSIFPQILFPIGFLCIFYFLILRPHSQQQKEKQELIKALQKGDVVYTNGGIVGKIIQLQESFYLIEIAANTRIYVQKEAIIDLVPKGSLKSMGFE